MKNLITILALFVATSLFGQEIILGQITAKEWNDVLKQMIEKKFYVKYDTEDDLYYLQIDDFINKAWIHLSSKDIQSIRDNIKKYQEWGGIATENSVKINKVLPNGEYKCEVQWKIGNDWYYSGKWTKLNVTLKVYSQSEKWHQLVIYSDDVASRENTYIEYLMPKLFLSEPAVNAFMEVISEANIEEKIDEAEEQKKKDILFK